MGGGEGVIVAGVGFSSRCGADALAALVRRAEAACGRRAERLAAPCAKLDHPALQGAAALLELELTGMAVEALQAVQPLCPTRSARAERATGLASVAEACALAAAGRGGRLLAPRVAGTLATCALAEGGGA